MIKIIYFGVLKEILGIREEWIEYSGQEDTEKLLYYLRKRNEHWRVTLEENNIFRIAINKEIVYGKTAILDGDEIAILPPVTGG